MPAWGSERVFLELLKCSFAYDMTAVLSLEAELCMRFNSTISLSSKEQGITQLGRVVNQPL